MLKRDMVSWTTKINGGWLVEEAKELFDEMLERSSVSWNAMQ